MTYSDQDENDITNEHFIEREGRGFKLKRFDPHGFWRIYHARNNQPVLHLQGDYTSMVAARQALMSMSEDKLPVRPTNKQVLTPKGKKDIEED